MGSPSQSRARALARLRRLGVLSVLLPVLALVCAAALLYRQVLEDARNNLRSSVAIAREHALKVFDTNEMLLARMLDLSRARSDEQWLANAEELHERLKAMAEGLPQVQGLFINGGDDRMLGSNRVFPPARQLDFSDREFAKVHRPPGGPRVFITEQLVSRSTGERFFDMSRRRSRPDGSYSGTANVSLRPEYFDAFWQEMAQATPGLRLSIVRADGRLVARWPAGVPPEGAIAQSHPLMQKISSGSQAGEFEADSAFDGVRRLGAFGKLGSHPVYVIASVDRSHVLAEWAGSLSLLALFAIAFTAALGWMATLVYRRTRDELLLAERLEAESARRKHSELAEEALRREKLALEQIDRAKDEFIAMLSHELRNPMGAITSAAAVQKLLPPQSDAAGKAREIVARQSVHMTRLIEDLLDVSRVAMGKASLDRAPMDVAEAVREAVESLRAAGRLESHDWRTDLRPAWARADRARIQQIATNLMDNALKFTPEKGRIEVRVFVEGNEVVLRVSDQGIGIAPDQLEKVFGLFVQGERSYERSEGGLGIGLALVKRLVEQHGGRVSAQSAGRGQGTTFEVRLPAIEGPPVASVE